MDTGKKSNCPMEVVMTEIIINASSCSGEPFYLYTGFRSEGRGVTPVTLALTLEEAKELEGKLDASLDTISIDLEENELEPVLKPETVTLD